MDSKGVNGELSKLGVADPQWGEGISQDYVKASDGVGMLSRHLYWGKAEPPAMPTLVDAAKIPFE